MFISETFLGRGNYYNELRQVVLNLGCHLKVEKIIIPGSHPERSWDVAWGIESFNGKAF